MVARSLGSVGAIGTRETWGTGSTIGTGISGIALRTIWALVAGDAVFARSTLGTLGTSGTGFAGWPSRAFDDLDLAGVSLGTGWASDTGTSHHTLGAGHTALALLSRGTRLARRTARTGGTLGAHVSHGARRTRWADDAGLLVGWWGGEDLAVLAGSTVLALGTVLAVVSGVTSGTRGTRWTLEAGAAAALDFGLGVDGGWWWAISVGGLGRLRLGSAIALLVGEPCSEAPFSLGTSLAGLGGLDGVDLHPHVAGS